MTLFMIEAPKISTSIKTLNDYSMLPQEGSSSVKSKCFNYSLTY